MVVKPPLVVVAVLVVLMGLTRILTSSAHLRVTTAHSSQVVPTDIVRVTLTRHPCNGSCPGDSITFSSDGRARYVGDQNATRRGSFVGISDTDRLFAAIAATGVESNGNATEPSPIDFPYTTLHIERNNGPPVDIQAGSAAKMPGIDAAAALAVAGADREVRWERDDGIASWLGPYQGAGGTLYLYRNRGRTGAEGTAALCHAVTFRAVHDGLHVLCGPLQSHMHHVGDYIRFAGSATVSGDYRPIIPHAYALAEHQTFGER